MGCRTTFKITGIGPGEREWGYLKHLNTSKRVRLSGEKTEKLAILYTTARINEARLNNEFWKGFSTGNRSRESMGLT